MGKHDRKEDTAIDAWLTEYLASYLVQDSGNSNGDNNTIGDNNALGDESADLGASRGGKEANENKKLCQHNNCKRKAKEDCAHRCICILLPLTVVHNLII